MKRNQQEVIDRILDLLTELVDDEPAEKQSKTPPMEMLTIKECTEAVRGISTGLLSVCFLAGVSSTSSVRRSRMRSMTSCWFRFILVTSLNFD